MHDQHRNDPAPLPAASRQIPYVEQAARRLRAILADYAGDGCPIERLPPLEDVLEFLLNLRGPRQQFAAFLDSLTKRELWALVEMSVNLAIRERLEAYQVECQGSA